MMGNYMCTFDGNKIVGYYAKDDKDFKHNLIKSKTPEMEAIGIRCKAFVQDYMERVIDKRLETVE
jgi:hypothetical protein